MQNYQSSLNLSFRWLDQKLNNCMQQCEHFLYSGCLMTHVTRKFEWLKWTVNSKMTNNRKGYMQSLSGHVGC